ncbi:MAG: cytochrome b/b6 domain-containing protein [Gammaproteobacteria bacterium]|nr:cytochrome b/b6 domain-containing protein [Gammaproteobacteria bacterium]
MTLIRVWDLPTRMFHWLFAAACTVAWVTGDDARYTEWHLFSGYSALGLLGFRLVWGVVGGRYARFTQFVRGPAALAAHLRTLFTPRRHRHLGHNPAGGWAVLLLLALVGLLGLSGIAVLGGEEGFGPLAGTLSIAQGVAFHRLHEGLAWALLGMVGLHLSGVALESLLQRESLPLAMVSGNKRGEAGAGVAVSGRNYPLPALIMLLVIILFAASYLWPHLGASEEQPYYPFPAPSLSQSALWQQSCGECHLAYHPSLLPQRSWEQMFATQQDHFDEELGLGEEEVATLLAHARANSAEQVVRELSWRTLRSLDVGETPLRITETGYWKQAHAELGEAVWRHDKVRGQLNCAACHRDAEQGGFMNGAMRLPR